MKICLLFLFVFSFQMMAINSNAQDAVIELKTNSLTVGQLISEIEKQTDYLVVYSSREVNTNQKFKIRSTSDKVSNYLDEAFTGTEIRYEFENNYIVLAKRVSENAGTIASIIKSSQQQGVTVTGTITDNDGIPVIGATIVDASNPSHGTVTDNAGKFILSNLSENAVLQVSYVGMTVQEVALNGRTYLEIIMEPDTELLDELIVVGYGTVKKQNLTGAVSAVNFDESQTSRPTFNLSSALTGLSSGLNISQASATPGAEDVSILVRGRGTMNDASPLVIIDGVPGALNNVNPNDVESVSVLKDAASSAIYGSRAANGVILVTTKRGAEGRTNVSYSGYLGWQSAAKSVDFITDMSTHMSMVNVSEGREKYANSLIDQWRNESVKNNPLYPNTDWYDEMLNTSILTEHYLSLRGGSQKTGYSMSLGYLDNKGIIDNSAYKSYSFRLNLDTDVTDWLTMGGNAYGSWSNRDPINTSIFFNNIRNTTPGVIPKYEDGRYGGEMFEGLPPGANPRAYVDNVRGNYERQKLGLKFYGVVEIFKFLEWENSFGFNYDNRNNWEYTRPYSLWNLQSEHEYQPSLNIDKLFNGNRRDYSTILNSLLRFNYSIQQKHNISALLGYDQQYNRMDRFDATKSDLLGDDAIYIMDVGVENESINGSGTDDALISYFGRMNYDYMGKYLFEANARYDGSSRFAKENRWGFFPSFSAGWRLTEENFAQPLRNIFDDIKIRTSWGRLGNNRIGDYTYQVVYSSLIYPFGGQLQQGVAPSEIANNKIKWETTTASNIGLDLVLLKNRMSLSIDYYNKTTSDILTKIPIPLVMGNFAPPWQNIAEMKNTGLDFQLAYEGKIGKDFNYNIGGNLSTVKNNVTKFNGEKSINGPSITQEGSPFNAFYVLEFDRIIQDKSEIDQLIEDGYTFSSYVGGTPTPGDMLYKDSNGDKVFNADDRIVKDYSSLPKITYGVNLGARYKDFDINIIGQGVGDVKGYWGNDGFNTFNINEGFLQRSVILDHWTPDNRSTKYPKLRTSGSSINTAYSDYWLYNTSYFRVKSIQLGYSLPKSLTSKSLLEKFRMYVNLENYFTITSFEGYNPENTSMNYPLMKQLIFGLNITF